MPSCSDCWRFSMSLVMRVIRRPARSSVKKSSDMRWKCENTLTREPVDHVLVEAPGPQGARPPHSDRDDDEHEVEDHDAVEVAPVGVNRRPGRAGRGPCPCRWPAASTSVPSDRRPSRARSGRRRRSTDHLRGPNIRRSVSGRRSYPCWLNSTTGIGCSGSSARILSMRGTISDGSPANGSPESDPARAGPPPNPPKPPPPPNIRASPSTGSAREPSGVTMWWAWASCSTSSAFSSSSSSRWASTCGVAGLGGHQVGVGAVGDDACRPRAGPPARPG